MAVETLREPIDPFTAIYLLQAAAALKGHLALGRCLSGFADEEFPCECPTCARELYVWPDENVLIVAGEDPVSKPATVRGNIAPGPVDGSAHDAVFRWLSEQSSTATLENVRRLLP